MNPWPVARDTTGSVFRRKHRWKRRPRVVGFRAPRSCLQLVKGGIELGETPEFAAVREMKEEAGIRVHAVRLLGMVQAVQGQSWSLTLCSTEQQLPARWVHRTSDDGGHDFRFFWQPLEAQPSEAWALPYRTVLAYVRAASSNISFDTETSAPRASRTGYRGAGQLGRWSKARR